MKCISLNSLGLSKKIMAEICGQKFLWAQQLVANEQEDREEALKQTIEWLKKQPQLEDEDALKIWYLLDNALWMTDRVLTQHAFCHELANIIKKLPDPLVSPFITAFYRRMLDRWTDLDQYRVEKFYVLVRYFTEEMISYKREHKLLNTLPELFRYILSSEHGVGLQMHFIDVISDQLPSLVRDLGSEGSTLLRPFCETFVTDDSHVALILRLNKAIIDPLLESLGQKFFGTDIEVIIKFIRGLISMLNGALKKGNTISPQIFDLRNNQASKAREVLAMVLKDQAKTNSAPPGKSTD